MHPRTCPCHPCPCHQCGGMGADQQSCRHEDLLPKWMNCQPQTQANKPHNKPHNKCQTKTTCQMHCNYCSKHLTERNNSNAWHTRVSLLPTHDERFEVERKGGREGWLRRWREIVVLAEWLAYTTDAFKSLVSRANLDRHIFDMILDHVPCSCSS